MHYLKMYISPEVSEFPGRKIEGPFGTFANSRAVLAFRSDLEWCYCGVRGCLDPKDDSGRGRAGLSWAADKMGRLLDPSRPHAQQKSTAEDFRDIVLKLNPDIIPAWISRDSDQWQEIVAEDPCFGHLLEEGAFNEEMAA